jgi:hypothetical protein
MSRLRRKLDSMRVARVLVRHKTALGRMALEIGEYNCIRILVYSTEKGLWITDFLVQMGCHVGSL